MTEFLVALIVSAGTVCILAGAVRAFTRLLPMSFELLLAINEMRRAIGRLEEKINENTAKD